MNYIEFRYPYTKLRGQTSGILCYATVFHMDENFPKETLEYDTDGKYTSLTNGVDYIQLVFLGNKEIPFTTYRDFTERNKLRFFPHVGEVFEFNVLDDNN